MKQEMTGWQWHQLDHVQHHLHLASDRQPRQLLSIHFYCSKLTFTISFPVYVHKLNA